MAKGKDDLVTIGVIALGLVMMGWFLTEPDKNVVCRDRDNALFDWLHGTRELPNCQTLISDMESRISAIESRLSM